MHILFLTDNFPPEVNAPASRTFEHCREWVQAGHQVTVVTCAPNFPKGKVYPGYRNRPWQSEVMAGIRVIRVWTYITGNEGFARRTLDYLSYMLAAVMAAPFVRCVDLVVGTSPQIFTACAAYFVSRYKGVPFVFELRDLWPESIKAVGAMKNAAVLRLLERLELFLYRKAALIIALTNSFKRNLMNKGMPENKIVVVTNGADLSHFSPRPRDGDLARQLGVEGKFVIGYIGTHGMAHGLDTALDAADQLQGNRDIAFLFIGGGAERNRLVTSAIKRRLTNVAFIDEVPKSKMPLYWSLLDVSMVLLRRAPVFTTVIPSKIYESVAMGIPIILGVDGEARNLVEESGIGLTIPPESGNSLVTAILRIKEEQDLALRLRHACLRASPKFDRRELAKRMLEALAETLAERSSWRKTVAQYHKKI